MNGLNRLYRPLALTDEVLQVPHVVSQVQCNSFRRFPGQIAQQAIQIHLAPFGLFGPTEGGFKQVEVGCQLFDELLNVARKQVAFGRRASLCYNLCRHGIPLLFTYRCLERIPCLFLFGQLAGTTLRCNIK
jgi:hypothetical protein